jgi:hypothetical protein
MWNFRVLRDGHSFYAKRHGGGTVLTDKRLSLYASWFEDRFSRFSEVKNFSLEAEGLAINRLESATIDEILALPHRREEINRLLGEIYEATAMDFHGEKAQSRSAQYENARKALINGLGSIKNIAEDAAESAETASRRSRQGRLSEEEHNRAVKKLDSATKAIAESVVKEIAGFLLPEPAEWKAEIAELTADPIARHIEFSARFFRSLAEAAGYNLRILTA